MLQARMFAYPDASRYRLGVNYQFLPTNANKSGVWCPTQRDGFMNFTTNYGGEPNYVNTRISPVNFKQAEAGKDANGATERNVQEKKDVTLYQKESDYLEYETHATTFTSEVTEDDFVQPRALWAVMGKQDGAQERFVDNVVAHVADCERGWLREEVYGKSLCS
jgi:catalase